jgi:hypothetical protein
MSHSIKCDHLQLMKVATLCMIWEIMDCEWQYFVDRESWSSELHKWAHMRARALRAGAW